MIVDVRKNWIFFLFFAFFSSNIAEAQLIAGKANQERSEQAIMALKDGALVVRLKSKKNKIEKLKASLALPELSEKDRKRLKKELETTIDENEKYNASLVAAFEEFYTFSELYFMFDTASIALKNGTKSNLFLNSKLELDPNITMIQDSFFVIYNGTLDDLDHTGLEALIIMDSQLENLSSPFPYYVRVNSFWLTIERFFAPKKSVKKSANKVVTKLNYNLNNFYKRVKAKT